MTTLCTVNRNLTFRVYPTAEQSQKLEAQGYAARALWNLIHDVWTFRRWRLPDLAYLTGEIKAVRKDVDWLGALPAQAAQAVLKTYRRAWMNCWNRDHPAKAPVHKSRASALAIDVPQARDLNIARLNGKWATVNVPLVGKVKVRLGAEDLQKVTRTTGARLVRRAGRWELTLRCEVALAAPSPSAVDARPAVGVDRGVVLPLALSDGTVYEHGDFLTEGEKAKKLRLEQKAARQERRRRKEQRRTSNRAKATRLKLSRLQAREARRRKDWQHKTSRDLANSYSLVVVEDLKTRSMTRSAKGTVEAPGRNVRQKAGLNRSILNEGWGALLTLLTYKLDEKNGRLIKVAPHYTSRECSACGVHGKRDSQAVFQCVNPVCELFDSDVNADVNAAINILNRGLERSRLDAPPLPAPRQTPEAA